MATSAHFLSRISDPSFAKEYQELKLGQRIVYHGVVSGDNVLLTGGGGVGKSHLIRFLDRHVPGIVLTASTGIAGVNIEGQTLDSFMGFNKHTTTIFEARRMNDATRDRLKALKILLIDEGSMTRIDRLDMVDARLKAARSNPAPFGGVQVILSGDFAQLPPVVDERKEEGKLFLAAYKDKLFAFESDAYLNGHFVPYVLTEYVRQGNEQQRRVLRNLRAGHKVQEAINYINTHAIGKADSGAIQLCKTNKKADQINQARYDKLSGEERVFYSTVTGDFPAKLYPAADKLELKVGTQILLTKNDPEAGFYNGDLGTIKKFVKNGDEFCCTVKLKRGPTVTVSPHKWDNHVYEEGKGTLSKESVGSFYQLPIRLGYAVTIHKSQGMTLTEAIVDLTGADFFNPFGLTYVALSRVTSFDQLHLVRKLRASDVNVSDKAIDFTKQVSFEAIERMKKEAAMLPDLEKLLAA